MTPAWNYIKDIIDYLHSHNVSLVKDVLIPSVGIDKILTLVGLYYVIKTFKYSNKLAKVNFITQLTQNHRDIWARISADKLQERITNVNGDPNTLTRAEKTHILNVILHIKTSYEAHIAHVKKLNAEEIHDIGSFLNYPLANRTWNEVKRWHEKRFVKFIEKAKYKANPAINPKPKTFFTSLIKIFSGIYLQIHHISESIKILIGNTFKIKSFFLQKTKKVKAIFKRNPPNKENQE